jgi:hypothetical protein
LIPPELVECQPQKGLAVVRAAGRRSLVAGVDPWWPAGVRTGGGARGAR